ncbi:hupE-ureJ family metal transporter [Vibrio ishigakensis]|uniref:HupE-ureJ family metal transporter n=1 Tax=Vibrio ishigakensis TaxID=1481914 RepID=A0A0B8NZU8_9VIBR|nr:HupE/UreJ family protein [Vibrio ishigakensis]GAM56558.1 hupE-ureJ family metal transporter [Vibrio ishigakensis]
MKLVILFSLLFSSGAYAHSAESTAGFLEGVIHPMSGLEHLLAMVAVGILSSRFGGATIWQIPALFIASLLIGLYLGETGFVLAYYQAGISLSLLLLGALLLRSSTPNLLFMGGTALIFGLFHGYAHGIEIGGLINPEGFRKGFFMGSVLIHVVGVMLGMVPQNYSRFHKAMRLSGLGYISVGVIGLSVGWL